MSAVQSRARARLSASVCVTRAQGKGNEDRWGSFKQPGFTSREASYTAPTLPWAEGGEKKQSSSASQSNNLQPHNTSGLTRLETHSLTPRTCTSKAWNSAAFRWLVEKAVGLRSNVLLLHKYCSYFLSLKLFESNHLIAVGFFLLQCLCSYARRYTRAKTHKTNSGCVHTHTHTVASSPSIDFSQANRVLSRLRGDKLTHEAC